MKFTNSLRGSLRESRKLTSIVGCSMLATLNTIVSTFRIVVSNMLEIGFSSLVVGVSGLYYGPILSGIAGFIADTLKYIVRPSGPYFPGFAINECLTGVIYGCFFYHQKVTLKRVILARFCVTFFINIILTSLWLYILYGNHLVASVRIIKNVVMFPLDCFLLYQTLKIAEKINPNHS